MIMVIDARIKGYSNQWRLISLKICAHQTQIVPTEMIDLVQSRISAEMIGHLCKDFQQKR